MDHKPELVPRHGSEFWTDLPDELVRCSMVRLGTDWRPWRQTSSTQRVTERYARTRRSFPSCRLHSRRFSLVLTHHIRNRAGAGWLNLGLALRRFAAWDCPSSRHSRD